MCARASNGRSNRQQQHEGKRVGLFVLFACPKAPTGTIRLVPPVPGDAEEIGRLCSCCRRPFAGSEGLDLLQHCPRTMPGDAHVMACMHEGLRAREVEIYTLKAALAHEQHRREEAARG